MSDEQRDRRGDGPDDGWAADATARMPRAGDGTRRMPPVDDGTRRMPPVDDGTRPLLGYGDDPVPGAGPVRPDATSVMPPVGGGPGDHWSGRAEVRAPRPAPVHQGDDWPEAGAREPRGRWWMPVVVGLGVLVGLAALGVGGWLLVQNVGGDADPAAPPVASAPPAVTTPPAATTEPRTEPTTTEPEREAVAVPALVGSSREEAERALERVGLASRVRFRVTDRAPAGTVIDSDPASGREVPPDTVVTLLVAAEPTTAPTTAAPTPSAGTDGPPDGD